MSNHVCQCEMKNLQVQSLLLGQMDNRGGGMKGTLLPYAFGETIFSFHFLPLTETDLIETSDFPPETNRIFCGGVFLCRDKKKLTSEPGVIQIEVWSALSFWLCSF